MEDSGLPSGFQEIDLTPELKLLVIGILNFMEIEDLRLLVAELEGCLPAGDPCGPCGHSRRLH